MRRGPSRNLGVFWGAEKSWVRSKITQRDVYLNFPHLPQLCFPPPTRRNALPLNKQTARFPRRPSPQKPAESEDTSRRAGDKQDAKVTLMLDETAEVLNNRTFQISFFYSSTFDLFGVIPNYKIANYDGLRSNGRLRHAVHILSSWDQNVAWQNSVVTSYWVIFVLLLLSWYYSPLLAFVLVNCWR